MSKLLNVSINLSKIDKSKLIEGQKGKYLNLTISVNNEKDQYNNDVSCWQSQTKEERESGQNKNFLGNGRVIWSESKTNETAVNEPIGEEDSDLPF